MARGWGARLVVIAALVCLGLASPATGAGGYVEYPLDREVAHPGELIVGPDGAIWFKAGPPPWAPNRPSSVGRVDGAGHLSYFPLGDRVRFGLGFVKASDGALWFGANSNGEPAVVRMTPTGQMATYPVGYAYVVGLAADVDGTVWFARDDGHENTIVHMAPTGTVLSSMTTGANSGLKSLVIGSDGSLWVGLLRHPGIGRMTRAGVYTEFTWELPAGADKGQEPYALVLGPDGNVWFTEPTSGRLGRITPLGQMTHFDLPPMKNVIGSYDITTAPDGGLWFTRFNDAAVWRASTAGNVVRHPLPNCPMTVLGIAVAAGPSIWIGEVDYLSSIGFAPRPHGIARLPLSSAPQFTCDAPNPSAPAPPAPATGATSSGFQEAPSSGGASAAAAKARAAGVRAPTSGSGAVVPAAPVALAPVPLAPDIGDLQADAVDGLPRGGRGRAAPASSSDATGPSTVVAVVGLLLALTATARQVVLRLSRAG